jgi:uncharacterized protein
MAHARNGRWNEGTRRAATVAGYVAGGAALASLGMGYYVARALTAPSRPSPLDEYVFSPFETGADYEAVTFPSADGGQMLQGWWLLRPETDRVIVACPGYRGSKSDLMGISTALWRAGFNVLLFDYHGHGAGRGAPVTLAYREVRDFLGALDYVQGRVPEAYIGVIGFSMGASIAIMGSARRPEVRAVVADSLFTSHADVVAHAIRRVTHLPGRPIAWLADHFLGHQAGYRHRDVQPIREVGALAPRPLLIIHGAQDTAIPVSHAHQVYEQARQPKELWIGLEAGHCGTYFLDRPAYCARVARFFERALRPKDSALLLETTERASSTSER